MMFEHFMLPFKSNCVLLVIVLNLQTVIQNVRSYLCSDGNLRLKINITLSGQCEWNCISKQVYKYIKHHKGQQSCSRKPVFLDDILVLYCHLVASSVTTVSSICNVSVYAQTVTRQTLTGHEAVSSVSLLQYYSHVKHWTVDAVGQLYLHCCFCRTLGRRCPASSSLAI